MLAMLSAGPCLAETGVTDKEILLGSPHMLSGPSIYYGQQMDVGLNAYFKSINEKGGIQGRTVRLISMDDKYEPDYAIACFQQLKQQGVFGIIGMVGSPTAAKYILMAENFKVPLIGFYSGPQFIGTPVKPYSFATRAPYGDEMKETVDRLWNVGARRFAVVYQNDAFGADELDAVKKALKAHHTDVVAAGSYTRNSERGVADAYKAVKAADPQVVILAAVYKPCVEIVKLARDDKWKPIFVMNSGDGVDPFMSLAGNDSEGMLVSEVAPTPTSTVPCVQNYLKALKKFYPNEKPNYISLRAYIAALSLAEGLKRAGKDLTRDGFLQAMESIRHVDLGLGSGMDLSYSPSDHLGFHKVYFARCHDGQAVEFSDWNSLKSRLKE
jgi:ABC-type branched-subunit amino acid transport system substrate-binding protein